MGELWSLLHLIIITMIITILNAVQKLHFMTGLVTCLVKC